MNEVNTRTMEFCRRWGIADQVLNCPFPGDHPLDAAFVTSLFGHELGRVVRARRATTRRRSRTAPIGCRPARRYGSIRSWRIGRAHSRPCDCITGTGSMPFRRTPTASQSRSPTSARGKQHRVTADYLVGCDGAASLVRRTLGIDLIGKGTIGYPINMFFRAPDLLAHSGQHAGHLLYSGRPRRRLGQSAHHRSGQRAFGD